MADEWTALSFEISGSPEPTSNDLETDRAALLTLVALAESRTPPDNASLDGLNIAVTPWVAWQMGIYTERVAGDTELALVAAGLALWAAHRSNDDARTLENTLTAANTCFRAGERNLAETLYEEILVSPLSANTSERFGAYLGMANVNLSRDNFRDAAYYFDKCLTSEHLILDEEARHQTFANATYCYRQCKDLSGALVFLAHLDADLADTLEKQLRKQLPPLEDRLLIIARLHVLGAGRKADALFATWNKEVARA
jgi:tetratricopeptide (TPR) repeat protein